MGRWAQARRRGSDRPHEVLLAAPVLDWQLLPPSALLWTWETADPAAWIIQSSVDGVTEFEDAYAPPGNDRETDEPTAGFYYRIAGVDVMSNLTTQWSNVVFAEL